MGLLFFGKIVWFGLEKNGDWEGDLKRQNVLEKWISERMIEWDRDRRNETETDGMRQRQRQRQSETVTDGMRQREADRNR